MNSYNIPELIKDEVSVGQNELLRKALGEEKKQVSSAI
jgi:hypothetical protein